jgi:DNA invertase Pin-like site-specific DNA recombinase
MNGLEKIQADHRERRAFVYARQSTMAQVLQHQASTERQLLLTKLAEQLGWESSQVELIDEDLGRSGKFTENRSGFQRLAAETGLGRVGAIFSLEASRLARSSADWHRLLEIAGLTRTLLIDEQSVYDPRDPNDRLVLGVKGTMADFELVWLRQRMEGGRWHLAKQGRYRVRPPIGYVYDGEHLVKDPDEEVQRTVGLLFERYRLDGGSCGDVVDFFREHKLRFPARDASGRLAWTSLTTHRIHAVLRNPMYAGAYVFGRRRHETFLEDGDRRRRARKLPSSQWPVLRRDAHPAYIEWEEYVSNQKRMSEHGPTRRGDGGSRGAPREGSALLQGMLLCGRCSQRLTVHYGGSRGGYPAYACTRMAQERLGDRCLQVSARQIDTAVTELLFQTLDPSQLDAATKVIEILENEDAVVEQQWKLRMERARYEAKRAERQYDACEPENRIVARTLETRWNEKLLAAERLEGEYDEWRRKQRLELTELDKQRIRALATDLPRLWRARTTTDRDRKLLMRLLIQDVAIRSVDVPRPSIRGRILWHTRAVTDFEVDRAIKGARRSPVVWRLLQTSVPHAETAPASRH